MHFCSGEIRRPTTHPRHLPQRICEGPRRLTAIDVEHVAVGVVRRGVDRVVVRQEAMLFEALALVEADCAHVCRQHVQVDGLAVVLVGRQQVGQQTVE